MTDEKNYFDGEKDHDIRSEVLPKKTSKEERSQERLENLLGSLEQGWKITIKREQPSWCRGHLETIEIYDPSEDGAQVDLEYLVRTWGGQKLHLKVLDENSRWLGGGSVSLFSFPPRVRGKLLSEEDAIGSNKTQLQPFQPYPPPQSPPQFDMNKILDLITKQKGADIPMLLKLLELSQARSAPQYTGMNQITGMADQMMGMMTLFKEMKNVFGDSSGGGGQGGSEDALSPVFAEVIKGLVQTKNTDRPSRGALVPPKTKFRPKSLPPIEKPTEKPTDPNQKPNTGRDQVLSLAEQLSRLSPEDASGVVLLAMDRMSAEKRELAMKSFVSDMSDEEDLVDDIDDQSDNLGDDPESSEI